ncbi:Hypothetical protein KVN_LOCUS279 [uncultured virus]|nr:Hypothetical protein KVN_LOCUS279 [uncultured virus]
MINDKIKKNKIKYKFIQQKSDNDEQGNLHDDIKFFYQICSFPDQFTNKYHMRKFVINSENEYIAINDYHLNKKQCKKFFSIKKSHEYKCYPSYNLDEINYPNISDILLLKSDLLSNDYDYSGFAPF